MERVQRVLTTVRPLVSSCGVRQMSSVPEMPPCDFTPDAYKGPSFGDASAIRKQYITPALMTYYKSPLMIHQGHMQWLWDHTGKRYLDMFAGIVTVSVGHCHPKVTQALEDQARKMWHTTNIYLHPKIHEYAEKMVSKLPDPLKVVYFVNSGTEANDLATLMARLYTGRFDVLSLRNSYHGGSPNLMAVGSMSTWKYKVPFAFGAQHTINPDPYRGPWGGAKCRDSPVQTNRTCDCAEGQCQASDLYIDQLKDVLQCSMPKSGIAGFFAESIQGGGGTVQFPKNYLKQAFELVRAHGGVCISDEVQTAFGRTGTHYWGFEGHGVQPDIVTTAKGIGNGFPLAAVITTPEIAATMGGALHFNTYGGNALASAVGSAVLDAVDEGGCQKVSNEVGTYLLLELAKLREEFEIVGDVRGKGLMLGVELVRDKQSREPLPVEEVNAIWEACKDMGLLIGKGGLRMNTYRIKPPMCVTKADADFTVQVMRKALQDYVNK